MQSATELKHIFQDGWNLPQRVENYVRVVADGEFQEGESLAAWRACLAAALETDSPRKILDVGTGPGVFACLYAQMGHDCVGLDFSARMLAEARRRAAEMSLSCFFALGDAEEPPFEPETFDAVSSRHLLFNLPRPGMAIRRWVRILKPGGRLILIGDEPRETPKASLAARTRRGLNWCLGRLPGGHRPGWSPTPDYLKAVSQCPLFRHSSGAIRAVMEAAGLQEIRSCPTDAIYAARCRSKSIAERRRFPAGQPYILVGKKE
jgi:SAM-dependent methyltransferase